MTKRPLKNVGASVRARLLARSRETGEDFQSLLWRYAVERFIFRLGRSPYRRRFVLKGAMLFVVWNEPFHRPTQDIDFAAPGTAGPDDIVPALQHVCRIAAADGVVFGADHMTVSRIRGATDEGGIRIRFPATVDVARVTVQVDVGFGDSIQPPPADAEFPPLLDTVASRVLAYPKEAVVSEKLCAAIAHGKQTSRYKDFFDLYFMARRFHFEGVRLVQAFAATFEGRPSPTEDIPLPLTTGFYTDTARGERWRAYLTKRGRLRAPTDFATVGELIKLFLTPPWRALSSEDPFAAAWLPGGPWQPGVQPRSGGDV